MYDYKTDLIKIYNNAKKENNVKIYIEAEYLKNRLVYGYKKIKDKFFKNLLLNEIAYFTNMNEKYIH